MRPGAEADPRTACHRRQPRPDRLLLGRHRAVSRSAVHLPAWRHRRAGRHRNRWQGQPGGDEKAATGIVARCTEVEPRLAHAEILDHRVGARPTRDAVRVEMSRQPDGTPLVHNYGHGGAGVTLSWGCAFEVQQLVVGV
ncbi:FAD-dependent oxidoreductase [Streptomyces hygroscopicus]|uniref:FAD-dependent oxidoreductase n=1 Tax=Streptomyces hygroscopicus TaxID=1912 RepID=UPI0033D72066